MTLENIICIVSAGLVGFALGCLVVGLAVTISTKLRRRRLAKALPLGSVLTRL